MENSTRRNFFAVTGAGAALGAAAIALPAKASAATVDKVQVPVGAASTMVAHVSNLHRGEVTLMVAGKEVSVVDTQLAARLAQAFHQAARR